MRFLKLAYKNLLRRKIRTTLTVGGVAIAVAVLVSLTGFNSGYKQALEGDLDKLGYQVLVTAKGCPYEAATMMLSGGAELKYMNQTLVNQIAQDPRIEHSLPQLIHAVFDPERGEAGGTILYLGVTDAYRTLKPWMTFKEGGWFSSTGDVNEVVMGYEVAELEQRHEGDSIFVPGTETILKVVGVFERSGTQDDGMIFMRMETLQRLFPQLTDKLTGLGIKLKDVSLLPQLEEDLYKVPEIQVVSMAQVKSTIMGLVQSARLLVMSVAAIALTVAAIGVINTILMSVFERTQEIGILKAMGASKLDIFRLIWSETLLICGLGGILGGWIALIGGRGVELFIRKALAYTPSGHVVAISWELLVGSVLGAILLGVVAGVYPAIRAASMKPIEAIRSGE
jgi:putative ABC transport system permease protein